MNDTQDKHVSSPHGLTSHHKPSIESPFIRAPESVRTIYVVTCAAACGPLLAGLVMFGYRSAIVTAISILSCAIIEKLYYKVTRTPALLGRSHAYLTGLLLALTLPAYVPWYVPVIGAAFAIIVGKAIFGGVGHFFWQPALVGRLVVAVMFGVPWAPPEKAIDPPVQPLLAQSRVLIGDILVSRRPDDYRRWRDTPAPQGADAFLFKTPSSILAGLTKAENPPFSSIVRTPEVPEDESQLAAQSTIARRNEMSSVPHLMPNAKPSAMSHLPPISEIMYGAWPGGIGETCIIVILVAGLYLIYRNYIKWQLPFCFVASAWCVAAIAPITLSGPGGVPVKVWWPIMHEGFDVGVIYATYQVLSCELMLAAFFMATEMTSRPVTSGGQVIFGIGCGVLAMLMKLYWDVTIPAYMAVLAMNMTTPIIDTLWRPRVFGRRHFAMFLPPVRRVLGR